MCGHVCVCAYLVGVVFHIENNLHIARFANERLRLLGLAAKHARLSSIGYVGFGIPVDDLCRPRHLHSINVERNRSPQNKSNTDNHAVSVLMMVACIR